MTRSWREIRRLRWRADAVQARRAALAREPLCRLCRLRGRTALAEEVDHILPLHLRPDLAAEPSNLQPLCGDCHRAKTRREWLRRGLIEVLPDGTIKQGGAP